MHPIWCVHHHEARILTAFIFLASKVGTASLKNKPQPVRLGVARIVLKHIQKLYAYLSCMLDCKPITKDCS